ncbi:MAG: hypothetical protein KGL39_09400 [Patescibacteria group bacterium]|nr:hypothetical protein [Patescibacteria group bacterium]
MHAKAFAVLVVLVILVGAAWRYDKLNSYLPAKWRHRSTFIGLNRKGVYVMARGGKPGVPGLDINTSDLV